MITIIGGTNMASIFPAGANVETVDTPFGTCDVEVHEIDSKRFYFLPRHGRNHATKAHRVNYRAHIWALNELGTEQIFAGATVGAVDPELANGALVIPDQIIDYTHSREGSFEIDGIEEHFDFTYPFTESSRKLLISCAHLLGIEVCEAGTYGCAQGPRFETLAEIRRMANDGCTLVGMTLMPEAALARQLSLPYSVFCLVVNPAAGVMKEEISLAETARVSAGLEEKQRSYLSALIRQCA